MEFDKVNAFLATAIGGLIFKWLASAVTSIWSWLNKSYPEEEFLVSRLGIKKPEIRLTFCKYKINTKPNTRNAKIFLSVFGTIVVSLSITGMVLFTKLLISSPIYWVEVTHNSTTFWLKPSEAKSRPGDKQWTITPELCSQSERLKKIESLTPETKNYICGYMTNPTQKKELLKAIDKNSLGIFVATPVVYLAILYFLLLGAAAFFDLHINHKITMFNKSEFEKSYEYLT